MVKKLNMSEKFDINNADYDIDKSDLDAISEVVDNIVDVVGAISYDVDRIVRNTSDSFMTVQQYNGTKEEVGRCIRLTDKLLKELKYLNKYFED